MGVKKIKIGIIGSGYMAQEYIKVLKNIKKIEVTGVVSRNLKKNKKFASKNRIKFFLVLISYTIKLNQMRLLLPFPSYL